MNCSEVRELLPPYADGELSPELEQSVRASLADCPDCAAELKELEAISALAREAFEAPVEGVSFDGFFDGVMARIEAEEAATEQAAAISGVPVTIEGVPVMRETDQGLMSRFGAWLKSIFTFERPLVSMASAAAIIVLVGGYFLLQGGSGEPSIEVTPGQPAVTAPGDSLANNDPKPRRRGMETEGRGLNAASVEEVEVAIGRVEIDENTENPDRPMVVWHIVDDNATSAPERGL